MIFAHRGLVTKNSPENSIASLEAAYAKGFRAIEFDLWFLNGSILIKHDQPKDESLPTLQDYFRFGNEVSYWLDFKNINTSNAKVAFEFVLSEIKKARIDFKKVFFVPFIIDYDLASKILKEAMAVFGKDVQFGAVCKEERNIAPLEQFCVNDKVKFLSVFHGLINANFVKKFSNQQIFAWTVNEKKRQKELEFLGIKNFATDSLAA